jgi:hypothetical protein
MTVMFKPSKILHVMIVFTVTISLTHNKFWRYDKNVILIAI